MNMPNGPHKAVYFCPQIPDDLRPNLWANLFIGLSIHLPCERHCDYSTT